MEEGVNDGLDYWWGSGGAPPGLDVEPIQFGTGLLKLALGVSGIIFLLAGIFAGNFGNGFLGVLLLAAASFVSWFQARHM